MEGTKGIRCVCISDQFQQIETLFGEFDSKLDLGKGVGFRNGKETEKFVPHIYIYILANEMFVCYHVSTDRKGRSDVAYQMT